MNLMGEAEGSGNREEGTSLGQWCSPGGQDRCLSWYWIGEQGLVSGEGGTKEIQAEGHQHPIPKSPTLPSLLCAL